VRDVRPPFVGYWTRWNCAKNDFERIGPTTIYTDSGKVSRIAPWSFELTERFEPRATAASQYKRQLAALEAELLDFRNENVPQCFDQH
jgi:hypothetical protein